MLQAALDLQGESITAWMNGAVRTGPRGEAGMANWFSPAPYGIYATIDGHVMISMSKPADLAQALDLPELAGMTERDGFERRAEISGAVATGMARLSSDQALERLTEAGIWHELVRDYDTLRDNPQVRHLGAFVDTRTQGGSPMTLLAHPIRYDGATPELRLPPQAIGAQTREILHDAGLSGPEIDALIASGAVAQTSKMRG